MFAEAIGTFVLVLSITGTAVAETLGKHGGATPRDLLAVPLAAGAALAIVVASLGPVSGAHVNPAVTLGLAFNRRFPWSYVPGYIAAQFAGAIGAALAVWAVYGRAARPVAALGATSPASGVAAGRVVAVEAVVTFILLLVVVTVASERRTAPGIAAVSIGAALVVAILISAPISGAGVNPARALGTMLVGGVSADWWAYILGPIVGGVAAVTCYVNLLRPALVPA